MPGKEGLTIKRKGYGGCAELRRKGARDIRTWATDGIDRFIICHDSDGNEPDRIRLLVERAIIIPADVSASYCIAVPVEEIESWMIADESAIRAVIPNFRFPGHANPESLRSPKEWLIKKSLASNGKPLYAPATFNRRVAEKLNLDTVARKCPSFRAFLTWLENHL
jgi:hypothetical protein